MHAESCIQAIQGWREEGTSCAVALEGNGQAAADAALVLGEDQEGTIAQNEGAIALGQQITHIEQRFYANRAVVAHTNGLAQAEVQVRFGGVLRKWRYLGNGILRLPAITRLPARSGAIERP